MKVAPKNTTAAPLDGPDFTIHWYHSLQFKVVASFVALFLIIIIFLLGITKTVGYNLAQQQAFQSVANAGDNVLASLEYRTLMASTIVHGMANAAGTIIKDETQIDSLWELLEVPSGADLIAGGGIWPEPYQLDAGKKRHSFFWGREPSGKLKFYDDYNQADSNSYHHEEWYLPVKYLNRGSEYWSRSYINPYSHQPTVTVTSPIFRHNQFFGAATVDLNLEGLQDLLRKATGSFGGYAFAVDRNDRFLSFPQPSLVINKNTADNNNYPYIKLAELAKRFPEFNAIATLLNEQRELMAIKSINESLHQPLVDKLSTDINHVQNTEARLIAAAILAEQNPDNQAIQEQLMLESDYLLGEPVYVSITTMENTHWQIVTVMPKSAAHKNELSIFQQISVFIFFIVTIVMLSGWLLIRYLLTHPLTEMSRQLSQKVNTTDDKTHLIESKDRGELGALAHWFNRRTTQLIETQLQVEKLAFFDPLTGLPNRRMLQTRLLEWLSLANRQVCSGAVLFLDIDQFKNINDSLGHSVGDKLLVQISSRLRNELREQDLIARIGGDEFVTVLVYGYLDRQIIANQAMNVAEKIIELFSLPFEIDGTTHHVSASIGISLFDGDKQNSEDILRQADTAMYHAKNSGRNTFRFFQESMQNKADQRLLIEKELREAIATKQLQLYYQLQVDEYGQYHAAEALVRWNHPEHGVVPPNDFIPIAEESTLIVTLGHWIMATAFQQMHIWQTQGVELDHIAINVSPRQFNNGNIVAEIKELLEEYKIDANKIMLEITEGLFIDHKNEIIQQVNDLKDLGIRISIDDFGTGYSSLLYLKQLPLTQLKIDQTFVAELTTDENDLIIVETIISMAKHLRLEVIAEGVESKEQFQLLKDRGCQYFQGYYFCQPVSAEDLFKHFTITEQARTL